MTHLNIVVPEQNQDEELCKQLCLAYTAVMRNLPNPNECRELVFSAAMTHVNLPEKLYQQASRRVMRLIERTPRCPSAFRKASYWNTIWAVMPKEESLELYLFTFPPSLTDGERKDVAFHICDKFGLTKEEVGQLLGRKFTRRMRACDARKSGQRCEFT